MSDRADLKSTEPYAARAVRPMGTETFGGGWRLKVYGIAYRGEEPRRELIQAGLGAPESVLPRPALSNTRYGLGFLGIHEGRDSNFVFAANCGPQPQRNPLRAYGTSASSSTSGKPGPDTCLSAPPKRTPTGTCSTS